MQAALFLALIAGAHGAVQDKPSGALTGTNLSPIQKVVTLVTEMKAQTIKEGEEDLAAYDKYKCWCETTTSDKTAAIAAAEAKLGELGSFVEEAAAREGELKTELAGLEADIAADTEALDTATKLRNEENEKFVGEEADMKETLGLLGEAVATLSKVQFVQKPGALKEALVQVRQIVHRASPKFGSVMQKDLFDMMGEFKGMNQQREQAFGSTIATGSFLAEVFLPKREAAALAQAQVPAGGAYNADGSITSDEEAGKASQKGSGGAAAGAKSYNSKSGGILGLLNGQKDNFAKNLASATKEEAAALAAFDKLAGAKNGEIAAATQQTDEKSVELADLMDKAAQAKEDIEATTNTLGADQSLLAEATKSCANEDALYAKRTNTRNEEVKALAETLDILTGDEARSLFDKTINFLQISTERAAMQEKAKTRVMQSILLMAKKHKNWQLASLAVRVKLDAFTKVKKAMDTMLAELATQQKNEYAKWESCKKDIDTNEDKIWNAKVEKRDLGAKHKDLVNTLATVNRDIDDLKTEVAGAMVSLKQAGEERKAQNQLFQTTVQDQRAMVTILNMALARLKKFYGFAQVHMHANPPPLPSGPEAVGYKKNGASTGVVGLLSMIIADAGRTDAEMQADEQQAQKDYADNVAATTASIEAGRAGITEREEQAAKAEGEKSETEEAQLGNQAALDKLAELLNGIHNQCDYVIKYFDIRQKSRAEEMDSIEEAKAILSGANFA